MDPKVLTAALDALAELDIRRQQGKLYPRERLSLIQLRHLVIFGILGQPVIDTQETGQ